MKRVLLVLAFLIGGLNAAFATCPQPTASMKDSVPNTLPMTLGSGADGNCYSVNGGPDVSETFSIASSTTSASLALLGTQGIQFNLTGTFSATVTAQTSNDNSNWINAPILNMTASPPTWVAPATGVTAVGNYIIATPSGARFARVNVTYTSGTVAGSLTATSQGAATYGDYLNWLAITATAVPCKAGTTSGTQTPVSSGSLTAVQCDLNGNPYVNAALTSIAGSTVVADPCEVNTYSQANINLSASGAAQVIAATSGKKIYACHIEMNNNAAEGVLVIEGTGTNCATGTAAVFGGTSAGTGYNFSANGGISTGFGRSYVWATNTAGDALCLNPSASTQLTGVIKYVVQ